MGGMPLGYGYGLGLSPIGAILIPQLPSCKHWDTVCPDKYIPKTLLPALEQS